MSNSTQHPYAESGSSPPKQQNQQSRLNFTTWTTPQLVETKHGSFVYCVAFKHAGGKSFLIALDGRRILAEGCRIVRDGGQG